MAWAVWLALPVAATMLAALWAWWRSRPVRVPSAQGAMQIHRDYLDALVVPPRGTARVVPGSAHSESAVLPE
ncbi:MAG: hypothetical protein M3Y44_07655 [Actinomycetota bacterium]|nr:hypothetical protein [Actinomycetota bacterium]